MLRKTKPNLAVQYEMNLISLTYVSMSKNKVKYCMEDQIQNL